jgi:hypothetical protein
MANFITRLFNYDAEKALAKEMSQQITQNISSKLMTERRTVLSAKKITRLLEQCYESAKVYQATYKPGTMRRAILANNFKWELKSNGYPDDFIDVATEGLIFELEKQTKSKAPKH